MKTLIFCDFDGTISQRDVGYSLFHHFSGGRNDALLPDWKAGRITSREVLTLEAAMVTATPPEIMAFLEQFEIDPDFGSFVELCGKNRIEPVILSDGLEFYIRFILERYHLENLPVMSNVGHLHANGLSIEFPRANTNCLRCGNCKGEIIDEYRALVDGPCRTVFIGDGYSDTCAARAADLLFAKKDLARYCCDQNIAYTAFDTFLEVASHLAREGYLQA
jgi:2,3-diketo-5-methylthio-1-phosphopentane phosphatase